MKAKTHPKWFSDTKVTCACGNSFTVGATVPEIQVEVCSKCHPFYTGKMIYVDTAGKVDAFRERVKKAKRTNISKTEKRRIKREKKIEKELERPDSLEELRKQVRKNKGKNKKKVSK